VDARTGQNKDSREHMMFASMLAGISFGNAGVHVPHALAYAIAGNVKSYHAPDYTITDEAIVPHGMAVILTAPASFQLTAAVSPRRHYEGICALRNNQVPADINPDDPVAVGKLCYDTLVDLMKATDMPNGLKGVGYTEADIDVLVKGAAQQQRLLSNAPMKIENKHLEQICKNSLAYW
jgi:hydroxyacid-oxoacid transhydrogenase